MSYGNLSYRISSEPADLSRNFLFLLRVPPPTVVQYKDHSVRSPKGDGGESRHGYKSVELTWDRLDLNQFRRLKSKIDYTADVYLTFPMLNGEREGMGWVDGYGKPSLSDPVPLSPLTGKVAVYANITLRVNNVTIINDPADFST